MHPKKAIPDSTCWKSSSFRKCIAPWGQGPHRYYRFAGLTPQGGLRQVRDLIAASGNAGPKSPLLYPGADRNVTAVTATDMDDKPFSGANRGKYVATAAQCGNCGRL